MIGKIEEKLKMDDYDLEAVFTPAVVNFLILDFVFTCTILPVVENTTWWHTALAIVAPIAAAVILTRFFMNFFRATSRIYEDIFYRKDRLKFPTTSMLLLSVKNISRQKKIKARNILKTKYKTSLCPQHIETTDEMEARRTAKYAAAIIRKVVAESNDTLTHRKLIRYGTFRNFLGGAIYCLPLAIAFWAIDYHHSGVYNNMILLTLIFYAALFLIDIYLTMSAADDYADTLITTFNLLNHDEA